MGRFPEAETARARAKRRRRMADVPAWPGWSLRRRAEASQPPRPRSARRCELSAATPRRSHPPGQHRVWTAPGRRRARGRCVGRAVRRVDQVNGLDLMKLAVCGPAK